MAKSVPLLAIGILTLVGVGAMFLMPGGGVGSNAARAEAGPTSSLSRPYVSSHLYTSLLQQATVKAKSLAPPAATEKIANANSNAAVPGVATPEAAQSLPGDAVDAPPSKLPNQSTVGAVAVNVRSASNGGSEIVAVLQPGQTIGIGATVNGWAEVTLPDGRLGWIYARYLASSVSAPPAPIAQADSSNPPPTADAPTPGKASRLIGRRARLGSSFEGHTGPSISSPVITAFEAGSSVHIVEVRGAWLRVVTSGGSSAWIRRG